MNLRLAYYGDDFTGSTDVMEALSKAGLRTVLFLQPPTPAQLARYPGLQAFGIAGGSRMMTPGEMEKELPPAFESLRASGAPIIHYKICSTFDSSPVQGSIGRAIELGRRVFGEHPTPLVVGAPVLGRYVAFGNLFARSGLDTEPFRLDRHPTMSRHPVTPMQEADLRRVLATQTTLPVELVDLVRLDSDPTSPLRLNTGPTPPIVLFDTVRDAQLPVIGRMLCENLGSAPLFTVGSSGLDYALTAFWNERTTSGGGESPVANPSLSGPFSPPACRSLPEPHAVDFVVAVSGSCSPVTDRQIARALDHGFTGIPAGPELFTSGARFDLDRNGIRTLLEQKRSVIVHTSRGAADPRFVPGLSTERQALLCQSLGRLLESMLELSGARRAVVCGGDTSMHVARVLGVEALEYLGPIAPGSPLCKVHAPGRIADGCELVFKGGQVGRDRFFLDVCNGGPGMDAPIPAGQLPHRPDKES